MIKQSIKVVIFNHPVFFRHCIKIANIFSFNRILKRKNNKLYINGRMRNTKIKINGCGNKIFVDDFARIIKWNISISGDNNEIYIGRKAYLEHGEICIEDDNGGISIGKETIISKHCHLAEIEGTKICIGQKCLFSAFVTIRTGDSHSIIDVSSKERINYSENVTIDNHVWLGNGATILKGVHIASNCVVGTNSVVTKSMNLGSVAVGNPAKIIKENIDWSAVRNI